MDDHYDICRVFEISKFDIARLTCIKYFSSLCEPCRYLPFRECSGSVVECLTQDRRAVGSSLTRRHCVVSLRKNINRSLVLVQPRKTCPFITERLLMGLKESNKTNTYPFLWLLFLLLSLSESELLTWKYLQTKN